jgi:hypothetical protein
MFPSLEYLDLTTEGIASGNLKICAGKIYPKLTTLKIQHTCVHPNFYPFIKLAAPNLEALRVSGTIGLKSKRDGHHVDLTGWNLERCILYFGNTCDTQCEITIQGISRSFIFNNNHENNLTISPSDSDYHRAKINSKFSVTCGDINHIRINSWRIKRIGDKLYCG